ncbi:MAG: hypothetical protein WA990_00495 [Rubrobacteraceae bacterium]
MFTYGKDDDLTGSEREHQEVSMTARRRTQYTLVYVAPLPTQNCFDAELL